uniref:Uncharacterized protein n=1 Tax=viral metagenome TaxID=1070528 RepID=A0A6C0JBF7_9ZZZZ
MAFSTSFCKSVLIHFLSVPKGKKVSLNDVKKILNESLKESCKYIPNDDRKDSISEEPEEICQYDYITQNSHTCSKKISGVVDGKTLCDTHINTVKRNKKKLEFISKPVITVLDKTENSIVKDENGDKLLKGTIFKVNEHADKANFTIKTTLSQKEADKLNEFKIPFNCEVENE